MRPSAYPAVFSAGRPRGRLAGASLVGLLLGLGCEPQEIYLFDGPPTLAGSRADADAGGQPSAAQPDTGPAEAAPAPPPCESEACNACVTSGKCAIGSTLLFCHPRSGECALPCSGGAGPRTPGNCPTGELCDPGGFCVQCLGDVDCGGPQAACDLSSNSCTECVVGGATCPTARPVCDPAQLRCVECTVDAECSATGQVCFEEAQRCVQCETDSDCRGRDDDVFCLPGERRCVECVTDADCRLSEPDKPFCSSERECEDERE